MHLQSPIHPVPRQAIPVQIRAEPNKAHGDAPIPPFYFEGCPCDRHGRERTAEAVQLTGYGGVPVEEVNKKITALRG